MNRLVSPLLLFVAVLQIAILFFLYEGRQRSSSMPVFALNSEGRPVYPYVLRELRNAMNRQSPAVRQLYQEYLARNPAQTTGEVLLDWYIDESGRAFAVQWVQGTMGDEALFAALKGLIEGISFPSPGRQIYVDYAFRFRDVRDETAAPDSAPPAP